VAAVISPVPAIVVARGPAQEEPREEDHRDDEYDAGDDDHPRKDLIQPTTPVRSIVVPGLPSRGGRFGPGFRSLRHVPNDATRIRIRGSDYWP
jgi:hypothetical protein